MGFRVKADLGPHAGFATHQYCNLKQETGVIFISKIGIKIVSMSDRFGRGLNEIKHVKHLHNA